MGCNRFFVTESNGALLIIMVRDWYSSTNFVTGEVFSNEIDIAAEER